MDRPRDPRTKLIKGLKFIGLSDDEIALINQTEILNVLAEKTISVKYNKQKEHDEIILTFNI